MLAVNKNLTHQDKQHLRERFRGMINAKAPDTTSSYLSEDDLGFAESPLTSDWNALAGVWKRTIRASSSKSIPVMQGRTWS